MQSLCARINSSMWNIQDLHPEKFTLKEMDNELHSMALICSLPDVMTSNDLTNHLKAPFFAPVIWALKQG